VQNLLAATGYPVPKAHVICTDMTILGGAFFVMDFFPGSPLIMAPAATVPVLMGQTHARLHQIDPQPLITMLANENIDGRRYQLDSRFEELAGKADAHPWLHEAIGWLLTHRPLEPTELALCHGDFHPLNLLFQEEAITAVLDWPGFAITDPVFDVAVTLVLLTIPVKHIAPQLGIDFSPADVEPFVQRYLEAYQAERPLDRSHLAYYQVFRCTNALIEGADGQEVWQHPAIIADLVAYIDLVTGIRVDMS